MKPPFIAAALGLGLALAPAADAQAFRSIDARQSSLDARIDQGIRSGALRRPEAARLRTDFRSLSRLERQYRANGLSVGERRDLDRRFDALSARIRVQKHDRQYRR